MELWVFITISAAFLQNIRSTLQKYLKTHIGTLGATFVRFGFGLPFAYIFLSILHLGMGYSFSSLNSQFFFWVFVASLAQILAQVLLIHLFSYKNFAVGTAYSRTEPAQAALFGLVFLSETVSLLILIAIAISVIGVMLISVARIKKSWHSLFFSILNKTTMIGLCSGSFFGLAAVGYRGASLALDGPNFMMQAATTLCVAISFQAILLLTYIVFKEPKELKNIAVAWRPALAVGFVGATASFGWFSAMTIEKAAIVKAVAQIEMLFAYASSVFFFKEKINRYEAMGCVAIVVGILLLLW